MEVVVSAGGSGGPRSFQDLVMDHGNTYRWWWWILGGTSGSGSTMVVTWKLDQHYLGPGVWTNRRKHPEELVTLVVDLYPTLVTNGTTTLLWW